MKILATKTVIEGAPINLLQKDGDVWIVFSRDDLFEDGDVADDFLQLIDKAFLLERIPDLKGKLDQPDKTTINIDLKTGELNVNKQHFHLGIPTHGAKATRQANSSFDFIHYIMTNSNEYGKIFAILLALLVAAVYIGWFFYIPFVVYGVLMVLKTFKTRDMYYSGALCPAIVIDAQKGKIAAFTDLSLGFGEYPIIRIRKVALPKKYMKKGQKIPVAGGYQNTEDYSHWNYFEPNPLPSGIKSDLAIEEKINQVPQVEWDLLYQEIKKMKVIPKEGYYPINIDSTSWSEIDLNAINWMQFGEEK